MNNNTIIINTAMNVNNTAQNFEKFEDEQEILKFVEGLMLFGENWQRIKDFMSSNKNDLIKISCLRIFNNIKKKIEGKEIKDISAEIILESIVDEIKIGKNSLLNKMFDVIQNYSNQKIISRKIKRNEDDLLFNEAESHRDTDFGKNAKNVFAIKKIKKKEGARSVSELENDMYQGGDGDYIEDYEGEIKLDEALREPSSLEEEDEPELPCYDQIRILLEREKGINLEPRNFKSNYDMDYFEELDIREYQELSTYLSLYILPNIKSYMFNPYFINPPSLLQNFTFSNFSQPLNINHPMTPNFIVKDLSYTQIVGSDLDFRGNLIDSNIMNNNNNPTNNNNNKEDQIVNNNNNEQGTFNESKNLNENVPKDEIIKSAIFENKEATFLSQISDNH